MKALLSLLLLVAAPLSAAPLTVLAYETEPFFYRQEGKPAGLEHDILAYYARATGRELEIRWVDEFEDLLPMLRRGEGEVAVGTITITPERDRQVDFSSPYFPVRVVLVEPRSQQTADLRSLAGATLATMRGTTYERLLRQVPDARLVYGGSEKELFDMVASGRAAALAADSAVALTLLPRYAGLRLGIPLSEEQGLGFAVREGSPLAAALSRHITQLKASKIYFRLLEEHLGAEAVKVVAAARD
ncbi:MAG TPA: transporter substrate-binding domain-containing protein [Thermoanaerobaculia bacterium]|nr:transporter substrate-binding domain-containing protein [Thermoanaerobaculia bacterium]